MIEQQMSSERPVQFVPLWARIAVGSICLLAAVLQMWRHFLGFEWLPMLAFGFYWLIYLQRQVGESWGTFLTKPRGAATAVLLLISLAGFGRNLYVLFTK